MTAVQRTLLSGLAMAIGVAIGLRKAIEMANEQFNAKGDRSGAATPLPAIPQNAGPIADARVVARPNEPEWVQDLAAWVPRAPRTALGRVAALIWASPSTLAGLLVGLVSGAAPTVREGVLVFAPVRGPVRYVLRRGGYAATTLGHVVLATYEPSPALMAHELVHTRQAERLGPLMAPVYGYYLIKYGYARHPMERAARKAGRRVTHEAAGHTRPSRQVRT